jgi:hypothetical protein
MLDLYQLTTAIDAEAAAPACRITVAYFPLARLEQVEHRQRWPHGRLRCARKQGSRKATASNHAAG